MIPAPFKILSKSQKEERITNIIKKIRGEVDPDFVNFISDCLEWDPKKRLTPE